MFTFAAPRPRRKPSLTPMIDVVFLLLVFFMLAARFGQDMALPLKTATGGNATWQGAPRLVEVRRASLLLNGTPLADEAALPEALRPLMQTRDAPVLLRAGPQVDLTRLMRVIDLLRAAGFDQLILTE